MKYFQVSYAMPQTAGHLAHTTVRNLSRPVADAIAKAREKMGATHITVEVQVGYWFPEYMTDIRKEA